MDPIQNQIVEKVRMSGCLSGEELHAFQSWSEHWESRSLVHQWDSYWTGEVPKHILRVKTNGVVTYHLPTSGHSKATVVFGVLAIVAGLTCVPLVPLGLVAVVLGILVIFKSKKEKGGWEAYKGVREAYTNGRRAALELLPTELQPANRVCLRCVKVIE
ncbi:hypothetical protein [Prosthecobacter sp.]|uniref:hypothetical protein n=1 Tax=Prosthecobacter sp. TaxID=1965333 RepID=UPI0037843181